MPTETNVGGVRIKTTSGETKLFGDGDYPVLRGTALILDESNANLWTTGYVPQLDTYIGPETPNTLFITVLRSKQRTPEIKSVLNNIMGLTKINYNSCNFNDGLPVTVRFTNMVGEVLTMGSAKGAKRQPFKYVLMIPETLQVSCIEAGHTGPDLLHWRRVPGENEIRKAASVPLHYRRKG